MVVKVYISGISGNKEVKKRQQRVLMILDSKNIKYEVIDITEPGKEDDKDFMQNNAKCNGGTVSDPNPRSPLPPQVFNDEDYCGDYEQFDLANEVDTLEQFLRLEVPAETLQDNEKVVVNGNVKESSVEKQIVSNDNGSGDSESKEAEKDATEDETQAAITEIVNAPQEEPLLENEEAANRLQSSEEIETLEVEAKSLKETSAGVEDNGTENGAISSREQSTEKENMQQKKENPSEALIESEKAVSAE